MNSLDAISPKVSQKNDKTKIKTVSQKFLQKKSDDVNCNFCSEIYIEEDGQPTKKLNTM